LNKLTSFLKFIVGSKNSRSTSKHELQDFIDYVVKDDVQFYHFEELEGIRKLLLNNDNPIQIVDLGAGSTFSNSSTKQISEVAKQQLSSPYQLRVISRMIQYIEAKHCLELGASLGLSSFYIAKSTSGNCISFEGNPAFIKLIEYQKEVLGISNLELIEGNFDLTFSSYLDRQSNIDFAFIDGNHRKEATIQYYHQVKDKCSEKAILVFDDIYWSKGMTEAWEEIKKDRNCKSSIDLYFMGIVFLDQSISDKKHLKIRPKKWF